MAITENRINTLGNGIAPITTSDFLKDNESAKNIGIDLTNIDPASFITSLTDKLSKQLSPDDNYHNSTLLLLVMLVHLYSRDIRIIFKTTTGVIDE
jgi:hypothetical protein